MGLPFNLDEVKATHIAQKIVPGAYVAQIKKVETVEDKQYHKISFDIVEGVHKGHYEELYASDKDRYENGELPEEPKWRGVFLRSYKQTAASFYKQFIEAIANSNDNFKFDQSNPEWYKAYENQLIGVVFGEEEFEQRGDILVAVRVQSVCTIHQARKGLIKAPKRRTLASQSSNGMRPVDGADLPF